MEKIKKDCVSFEDLSFDELKLFVDNGFLQVYTKILDIDVYPDYEDYWDDNDYWSIVKEIRRGDDIVFMFDFDLCKNMEDVEEIMEDYIEEIFENKWSLYGSKVEDKETWIKKPLWMIREDKIKMIGL